MTACIDLLERQRSLARRYLDFCDSLHPERTVLLADLASDPGAPRTLGIESWFDQDRFRRSLRESWGFLSELPGELPRRMPLIFYQRTDPAEDRAEFERRCKFDTFSSRMGSALPEASYLVTLTSFTPEMVGSWEAGDRLVKPLAKFSNWGWRGFYPQNPGMPVKNGIMIGYRVPDFPELLRVSGTVATDYMAREVVHDLGHGWLPDVEHESEPLHDALMVRAMRASPLPEYRGLWERLVHLECTDPAWFVGARRQLRSLMRRRRGDHVSFLMRDLLEHHERTANPQRRHDLWHLSRSRTGERASSRVDRVLDQLVEGGFMRYRDPLLP